MEYNMKKFLFPLSLAVMIFSVPVQALDNDINLNRFATCVSSGDPHDPEYKPCIGTVPNLALFESLSADLGLVFSPRFLAPSETLGQAGFEFGGELSFSVIDNKAEHWQLGIQDRTPPKVLTTTQIHLRKGLPFSLEIGAVVGYMVQSELFSLGAELKWALLEGFFFLPDITVRGTVNTVVGSSELNLTTAGFDISVSKAFGIVGMLSITPYVGYNLVGIFASSRILTPGDSSLPERGVNEPEFVFGQTNMTRHRAFFGFRVIFYRLVFSAEADIASDVKTFSMKLGFDF